MPIDPKDLMVTVYSRAPHISSPNRMIIAHRPSGIVVEGEMSLLEIASLGGLGSENPMVVLRARLLEELERKLAAQG